MFFTIENLQKVRKTYLTSNLYIIFCPLYTGVCFREVLLDWLDMMKIQLKQALFLYMINLANRKRPKSICTVLSAKI